LETIPGKIATFFGAKKGTVQFYGSGTVWHHYPSFTRCDVFLEGILADFYTMVECEEKRKRSKWEGETIDMKVEQEDTTLQIAPKKGQ
jgi:hypothetical protein